MHTNEDSRRNLDGYEAPTLTMRGSAADVTRAFLIGIVVDSNHSAGQLIIGNTSL